MRACSIDLALSPQEVDAKLDGVYTSCQFLKVGQRGSDVRESQRKEVRAVSLYEVRGKVRLVASYVTKESCDFVSDADGFDSRLRQAFADAVHKLVAGTFRKPRLAPLEHVDDGLAKGRPARLCLQVCHDFIHRACDVDHGTVLGVSGEDLARLGSLDDAPTKAEDVARRVLCEQLLEHLDFSGTERGPAITLDVVTDDGREFLFKVGVRVEESPPQRGSRQFSDVGLSRTTHPDDDHGCGRVSLSRSLFSGLVKLDALHLETDLQEALSKR